VDRAWAGVAFLSLNGLRAVFTAMTGFCENLALPALLAEAAGHVTLRESLPLADFAMDSAWVFVAVTGFGKLGA